MLVKLLFLLLPAFAYGSIRIYIEASTEKDSHVEYIGANVDVVGEEEIALFELDSDSLKQNIADYAGASPSFAFVRAPTDVKDDQSQDLYTANNYEQVTRRIIPMTGSTLQYNTETVEIPSDEIKLQVIKEKPYVGTTDLLFSVKGYFKDLVPLSKGDDVLYVIEIGFNKTYPSVHQTFKAYFGNNVTDSEYILIERELDENLQKMKNDYVLKVTKVYFDVEINYVVSLGGHIVVQYPEEYKGKQIWGYDVNEVLRSLNKRTTFEISQVLQVVFYTNPELVVKS